MSRIKLKGTHTEQAYAAKLEKSRDFIFDSKAGARLKSILASEYPELKTAYILDSIPDEDEDIYLVLVNNENLLSVELDRDNLSATPIFEHKDLGNYKKRLRKSDQIQLSVAMELGLNAIEKTQQADQISSLRALGPSQSSAPTLMDMHAASVSRKGLYIALAASLILFVLAAYRVPLFSNELDGVITGVSQVHNDKGSSLIATIQLETGAKVLVSMPENFRIGNNVNVRVDQGRSLFGRKSYRIIADNQ